jgi:Tfp pilus assembly major pilin PilA
MEITIAALTAAIALILYQHYVIRDLHKECGFQFYTMVQAAKGKIEMKFDPEDGGLWIKEKE